MDLSAHAYVIRGSADSVPLVLNELEKQGTQKHGNSDLFIRAYTSFSIDDARSIRDRAQLRSMSEGGRFFIIAAPSIPPDAQNALLKTFEEPPAGAKFFLIVSSPEMLLPTLRSRMQVLDVGSSDAHSPVDAMLFLRSTQEKRIEMLKPLLEKGDDDKRDLAGTLSFLAELERALATKPKENSAGIHAVYLARKFITDRGALAKTLLEQCALVVPHH